MIWVAGVRCILVSLSLTPQQRGLQVANPEKVECDLAGDFAPLFVLGVLQPSLNRVGWNL